ncbi:MAG TPA: PilZ domain-containing protein [Polyangiaceae bacterium]
MLSFTRTVADAAALRALFEKELAHGRAFVAGAGGVEALTACELVLEHGGRSHRLAAEVVFVKEEDPGRGVGLQLAPMDAAAREALRAFVEGAVDAAEPPESTGESARGDDAKLALSLQERIRALTPVEQQRLAATGMLSERVALERMFGSTVWETLLRNARLTVPEVARIGRKGTLPRPLVELIAGNPSWLAAPEVQRALLANPRCSPVIVEKVLRSMTRSDLQLVPQQTAYPATVREAAKRMLGR